MYDKNNLTIANMLVLWDRHVAKLTRGRTDTVQLLMADFR